MRRKKRLGHFGRLRFALCVICAFACINVNALAENYTNLGNGTYFTVQGKSISGSQIASTGNCWTWAKAMYNKIWEVNFNESSFTGYASTGHNLLRNLGDSDRLLTADHLRMFIGASQLGANIRITACTSSCSGFNGDGCTLHSSPGHNLILVAKDSNGFTVIDDHTHSGTRAVYTFYYTWQGFVNYWYGAGYPYIKYIKWPNAPVYNSDNIAPTISNIRVSNVSSSGYTVTCTVSDNVGVTEVKFPTWTEQNGQDDLIWHVGTISGNTASFNVRTSDHNNETGCTYITHIYAYDAAGNSSNDGTSVFVPAPDTTKPTISNVKVSNLTTEGYTVTCTVSDNVGVTKVQFPTWYAGQQGEDATWHDGTISGNTATCYIRVSDHGGKTGLYYHTDIYAWDAAGNVSDGANAQYNFVPNPEPTSKFKLPKGLKEIGEEAFAGIDASYVIVPEGVKIIGKRAFADCTKLEQIYIPKATTRIASDAFVNVPSSFVIRGKANSYAQTYATNNGYHFVADTGSEWSDWVTEDQLPTGTIQKESKQQYRYRDKVYSAWSGWSPRTETRESTGELKKEQQVTEHYWYYDLCQNCGRHSPYTVCWDCGYNIGANWRVTWLDTSRNEGGQFGNSDKIFTMTEDGRWFYWTDDNGNGDSRTVYQYATRTYSWSNWSEWSDSYVASSSTRNVEVRTVYRYKLL